MWVTSVVRPIRFDDLRHTTGGLLTMQGANLAVQRIMRHKDPRLTSETYLHLDPGYLRREIDGLTFGVSYAAPPRPRTKPPRSLVPIVAPAAEEAPGEGEGASSQLLAFGRLMFERDSGFEPPTFSLGKLKGRFWPQRRVPSS